MHFAKYHALGNDYIVIDPTREPGLTAPSPAHIQRICHRNFGVGSDGILWGPLPSTHASFGLRIFNPDGSEAEKSGNGLRIFFRYLYDYSKAGTAPFTIETTGGIVGITMHKSSDSITVEMGQVSFLSKKIPVTGPVREVLNEKISLSDRDFTFCAATIGNPHCVLPLPEISSALAHRYGPEIEKHSLFPHRTNVQFFRVLNRSSIEIEIWERGAGYTLASGSSSSAAAAVAHRLGLVDRTVAVHMPGGRIDIEISPDFFICMTGPVTPVADGSIRSEIFSFPA